MSKPKPKPKKKNGGVRLGAGRKKERLCKMPVCMSTAEVASQIGADADFVREAKDSGVVGFSGGKCDLAVFVPALVKWLRAGKAGPGGQGALPLGPEVSARKELDMWQAKLKKLDYEEKTGLVIPKQTVRAAVAAALPKFFDGLTRIFCNELPPKLVGLREPEIRKKSAAAVDQLTTGLRESFEALAGPDGEAQAEGEEK